MNLAQFQTNNRFLMLALDHRGSFKKLMNPENPNGVSDKEVVDLKAGIINALSGQFSGLLIDETYGLEAYPDHKKPFLLPVEKSGYIENNGEKVTEIEYRVTELITMGAKGAKMLLYFNPSATTAKKQIETALGVMEECRRSDFPFFLEPVTYLGEKTHTQDPALVLGSLNMLKESGVAPGVFKVEYPGDFESCRKISGLLGETPWILLTNPDSFEEFEIHLAEAVRAGCKGFLAGRAVWQEVCSLDGGKRELFLKDTLPQRFEKISRIVLGK